MNSLERVYATLQGKPTDRRALSLTLSLYGAKLTDCPIEEYYTNPVAYARGQSAVLETFKPDILFSPFALALEGAPFGSEIRFYKNQPPIIGRPVINSASEINSLAIPDIDSSPGLLFFSEAARLMVKEHGHEAAIVGVALDPVGLAALVMGFEGWLNTLLFDKDGTKRVLDVTVPYFVRHVNSLFSAGVNCVGITALAFINPSIVTHKILTDITIPALKEAFGQVGGALIIHHTGLPLTPSVELLAQLPNVIGFVVDYRDNFDLIRQKIGPKFTLIGNLDGPNLYKQESADILKKCTEILNDRREDPYFMLGTSCADIGMDTPAENIHVFRQAAEMFAASR